MFPGTHEFLPDPCPIGNLDSFRELVERQPSREKMIAQRDHRLLALDIGDVLE